MALTDKLRDIGDAIRDSTGEVDLMTLADMPGKISSLYRNGRASVVNPFAKDNVNGGYNPFKYWAKNAITIETQIRDGAINEPYLFMWLLKPEDTKNETDFGHFYADCTDLTFFPDLVTSNGEVFDYMFWACKGLTTAPFYDTSKGKDFRHMFGGCENVQYIPKYDTSNGELLTGMFYGCTYTKEIPNLDTSKGVEFQQFLDGCWCLKSDIVFDTSNGTNFYAFARNCQQVKTIDIDVSKATTLKDAFKNCNNFINVNLGTIPVSVSFANSKKINIDSLMNIIRGLKVYYKSDPEYMKHTITLSAESWNNLYDYVSYFMDPLGTGEKLSLDDYIARKGWLRA